MAAGPFCRRAHHSFVVGFIKLFQIRLQSRTIHSSEHAPLKAFPTGPIRSERENSFNYRHVLDCVLKETGASVLRAQPGRKARFSLDRVLVAG